MSISFIRRAPEELKNIGIAGFQRPAPLLSRIFFWLGNLRCLQFVWRLRICIGRPMDCIANTSPLIAFSSAGCLEILRSVSPQVWVPREVFDEIVTRGDGWNEAIQAQQELIRGSWIQCAEVADSPRLRELRNRLGGSGEAEAITLAAERGLPVLLDELAGRRAASALGLKVIGSLGILRVAKSAGTIHSVRPVVMRMIECGIYFGDELIAQFLREVGEM